MALEWWHWAVLGFVLIIAELAVPSFVLIWFGLGALVVAGVVWVAPGVGLVAQILTLIVVSSSLIALWFRVVKPSMHKTRLGMADADITGQVGLLVEEVAPYKRGKVRFQRPLLGADVWECIADEPIEVGVRVKVLSVEGSFVKIGRS